MTTAEAFVQAEKLGLTFSGGVTALEHLDLSIARGEFAAIVGPSGCGKSTLLRLAAGLIEPSQGRILLAGQPPAKARREAVRASFVFQDATLLPWRSVADNIGLPLELVGLDRAGRQERVAESLAMINLAEFACRFPAQLSGGMRMRVSLARALATEPDLLLLDEPFAALDDITRQTLNEELMNLWNARRWTAAFVTHNIAEAVFLSQRVAVMTPRPGRIAAEFGVPFSWPRRAELRSQAEFARLCGEVAKCLREVCR